MKRIICILVILSTILPQLVACEKDKYLFKDYSQYVASFYKYELNDNISDDNLIEDVGGNGNPNLDASVTNIPVVSIDGFKPIIDYQVSSASNFFGSYAYVTSNQKDYLVDLNGNMHILQSNNSTMSDIITNSVQFIDDKIVAKTENGYGLLDAFGKIILPFQFDSIDVCGDFTLAKKNNKQFIYEYSRLLHELNEDDEIKLIDETFALINQKLFNLSNLSLVSFGDYYAVDAPSDNVVKISNGSRYGYGNIIDNSIIIEPKCVVASRFSNGIASIIEYKANSPSTLNMHMPKLIGKNGEVVYDFNSLSGIKPMEISIYDCHDNFSIYSISENYSAIKIENNVVVNQISLPHKPDKLRIYGNYAIFPEINKLYSIVNDNFVDLSFLSIKPILNNHFIVENDENNFSLLDANLSVLIEECEDIESSKNTLIVKKNGLYSLYKINEAN